ncbi:hypothetical protein DFH11DRAFT_363873 [Phellopilus nigrolimitatus]|nr:hypothetical protein DFH11DRAFT_363873 [Phellopilus nigrolimitatus]
MWKAAAWTLTAFSNLYTTLHQRRPTTQRVHPVSHARSGNMGYSELANWDGSMNGFQRERKAILPLPPRFLNKGSDSSNNERASSKAQATRPNRPGDDTRKRVHTQLTRQGGSESRREGAAATSGTIAMHDQALKGTGTSSIGGPSKASMRCQSASSLADAFSQTV